MVRCALYCRVSTEEQARHGLSMPEQEHALEAYAHDKGYAVAGRYLDGGISARKRYTNRPELMRLLTDVEAGRIDMILFIKLDRWFRNVADYYEVQRILDEHNVTWQATEEDYETVTASGRFKVNIMLSVAQDEADRTSERIKFIFDGKRERGEPLNGKAPLGYKNTGKEIILDAETAPLVRRLFETYLETGSMSKARSAVPGLDLTTEKLYYTIKHAEWYTGSYRGMNVPPILTEAEYERCTALKGHKVRKTYTMHTYLFSGLLYCPQCGKRLCGRPAVSAGKPYMYYVCGSWANRTGCTNKKCYNEDKIEQYFLENIESEASYVIESSASEKPKTYEAERRKIRKKLSRLSDLYVNDMIEIDDYKKQYEKLQAELNAVPEDEKTPDAESLKNIFFPDWQAVYADLNKEDRQKFWRRVIKHAVPDENGGWSFTLQ